MRGFRDFLRGERVQKTFYEIFFDRGEELSENFERRELRKFLEELLSQFFFCEAQMKNFLREAPREKKLREESSEKIFERSSEKKIRAGERERVDMNLENLSRGTGLYSPRSI